jgi:hypothetical protein
VSSQLTYALGRLDQTLADKNADFSRKLLAIIFHADPDFSIRSLAGLTKNEKLSIRWRSRVHILLSALLLTKGDLAAATSQIRQVSFKQEMDQPDQWQPFYTSTGNYLVQLYRLIETLPTANPGARIDSAILGDSHVLGMAAVSAKSIEKIYLPTVTFRLLASPQDNALKVAFRNAAALTYRLDALAFSVGEIDSRGFVQFIKKDNDFWNKRKDHWRDTVAAAYSFIGSLRHPLQEYVVIIPPMPSEKIVNAAFTNEEYGQAQRQLVLKAVEELRDICRHEAQAQRLKSIEYSEDILSADGLCQTEKLLDHAHFTPDIYSSLVNSFTKAKFSNF